MLPSKKATVPAGVTVPDAGATVALNITVLPEVMLFGVAVSEVVVFTNAGAETVTVTADEVLVAKVEFP